MQIKKRLRSLRKIHDTDARNMMETYPAQWDMDDAFETAYQGYLLQKNESAPAYSELKEEAVTEKTGIPRRIGVYAGFAAVLAGVCLLVMQSASHRWMREQLPDETDMLTVTHSETEESTASQTMPSETIQTTYAAAVQTTASDETMPMESASATLQESILETIPPMTETAAPESTKLPASSETETHPLESTTETTTEATATIPPEHLQGHFVFNGIDGVTMQISFVRESTEPIRPMQHSFAAEGFTVTDMQEKDSDEVYHSILYRVEREDGQEYQVRMFSSLRVVYVLEPVGDMRTKSYEIDGKPSYLVYHADDPDADCVLMWFDGCHICYVNSPLKNLDDMERLVKSQVTYEGE